MHCAIIRSSPFNVQCSWQCWNKVGPGRVIVSSCLRARSFAKLCAWLLGSALPTIPGIFSSCYRASPRVCSCVQSQIVAATGRRSDRIAVSFGARNTELSCRRGLRLLLWQAIVIMQDYDPLSMKRVPRAAGGRPTDSGLWIWFQASRVALFVGRLAVGRAGDLKLKIVLAGCS